MPRIDLQKDAPAGAMAPLFGLERYLRTSGLDHSLLHLLKTRASQINGCAYCIDMHTKDARAAGESEQRLYALNAWHETPFFTDRERAALEWTEAVTLISQNRVPDDLYERVSRHFNPQEMVNLTLAVAAINAWNRLAIAFRSEPGTYQPHAHPAAV